MKRFEMTYAKSVRLVDNEGCTITEREIENRKEAKETAKYLLSDAYAKVCETDHVSMGTDHAELWIKGEHIQDYWK